MNLSHPGQFSRRRLLGLGGGLAAGIGLAPMLTACGDSTSSAATPAGGGTLTMGINATPDTLDPGATGLALTLLISFALFDPLVYWLPDGKGGSAFHPGLAESWTISPDASVYTFKLRKGVTFHDGTTFDAKAVKATYDHVVDPKTKSKSGLGALGPYKETKILDDYTVQIVFTAPNASFLHQQAAGNFGISSPAALAKYGPTAYGNNPVGTGPFTFQSYQAGSQLTLLKNPKYTWGPKALGEGPAKLDKLVFRIVTDDSGRYNALQSGQLQIAMNLPPNNISAAQKSGKFQQLLVPSIGTPLGMPINVTKPPTDDPLVRQAIMYAVDQDALVKDVLYDVYKPAHNVLTPITPGYSAAASKTYSYDPDKAGQLLDQAGWTVGDGGIRTKNGKKLSLEIILFSGGGLELPTQFAVSELQKAGFSANTAVQPFATAQASFNSGAHNLGSFGYYGADPYLLNIWVNSNAIQSGFNWSHYANPAVDKLIAKANATAADATRNGLYEQVGAKLMQDSMYLPLWDVAGAFTLSPKVQNLHQTLNGYLAFHSATVG
ncbi:peptide/nickel transport system substrate-binding protein [Kribbella rubisoli]|uniref:Peptide/nickel transport system substrate-binding protein n=1 Tax=Kribbella rubisoli TaxID=3075929 RepID=A0A4Q7VYB6_9ACTN|nr:ABC transporter substrate-binding protein [Kribbella rubisoli]RZU01710.1 peptide/nickel transport system substrate-binding protein [Kribbella rubisoli]